MKNDDREAKAHETFEKGILRKIIRQNWENASADPRVSQALEEHASRMETILGTLDYGAICMPNVISNSKRMSPKELTAYLALIESLGVGYKSWFNSEFANIFVAGLTLKARDTHSALRYLEGFVSSMEKRISYYQKLSEKENKTLEQLIAEYEGKNSGILRFFKKGELNALSRMINLRKRKAYALSRKATKYNEIIIKTKKSTGRG